MKKYKGTIKYEYYLSENNQRTITSPKEIFNIVKKDFSPMQEKVWLLILDTKYHIVKKILISQGGISNAIIDIKVIFKTLIKFENSSAFMIVHNHPSGNLGQSKEDINVCNRIKNASEMLGYTFLDFIIFSKFGYNSFVDSNIL